jgi:hypothetical protein
MEAELATMPREATPMSILQMATEKGANVETIERLSALAERWQDRKAQEEFAAALAKFQTLCPTVFKGRATKEGAGGFGYKFASFDDIMREAGPILSECGISVGFDTSHDLEKGMLTVTCRIRVGGHFEDRTFSCPVASSLKVSEAQKFGSALSYAKRYCFCAAMNIVVTDEDDDGTGTFEYIDETQVETLNTLIAEKNANFKKFLEWAQIPELSKMLKSNYAKAIDMLRRKARSA